MIDPADLLTELDAIKNDQAFTLENDVAKMQVTMTLADKTVVLALKQQLM